MNGIRLTNLLVPISYDGSDDEEEVETVLAYNENNINNYNLVSNSESDDKA